MTKPVLAVDFGTSNSYFCKCPSDELLPSPVDFIADRTGMDTVVLYREGKSPLVGSMALNTWGEAAEEERRSLKLITRFKPEIDRDKESYRAAVAFLSSVREEAEARHIPFDPRSREVYFGVPCQAGESYLDALTSAAFEAGYGRVKTLEEPLGALLYHISQRDMAPSEAMGRVLVLDFGGGTCDLASLEGLSVRSSWGDWSLGGRLFDDLFFRILCERNPGLEESMDEGTSYFVHWYWSRILKESFSTTMARDRSVLWSGTAGAYGGIRRLGWDEFMERISDYRPTEDMIRSIGGDCPGSDGPENLVDRLENLVLGCDGADSVILAGGSSLWPFVSDLVQRIMPEARLIRSDQPYGVVSRGLALFPALKNKNGRTLSSLRRDMHRFVEEIRTDVIDPVLEDTVDRASDDVASLLIGEAVIPALEAFRRDGGKISAFEKRVTSAMEDRKDSVDRKVTEHLRSASEKIPVMVLEKLALWFRKNGVRSMPRHLELALGEEGPDVLSALDMSGISPVAGLSSGMDRVAAVLAGAVVASICGGGGIALIASGLPGLLLGGVIGLGGYALGRERIRKGFRDISIPKMMARAVVSEGTVEKAVAKSKKAISDGLQDGVRREWAAIEPELMASVEEMVRKEIAALSMLNQLEGGVSRED